MGGVRTPIIGRPRPSPRHRRAAVDHTPATPSFVMSPFASTLNVGFAGIYTATMIACLLAFGLVLLYPSSPRSAAGSSADQD